MKGLIIQLAGREPSQDRRGEGVKEKKKKKSKNLVVLLRPGPSSPMLCSSCKRTSQNKSRMPRAILLSAHTPAPPIHTNLCGISLLTSSLLCARSVRCLFSSGHPQCLVTREARGRVWPCRLAERSSTFLRLLIELSHVDWNTNNPFVNSHVWLKSRMDTADGSGIFERGGGPLCSDICAVPEKITCLQRVREPPRVNGTLQTCLMMTPESKTATGDDAQSRAQR